MTTFLTNRTSARSRFYGGTFEVRGRRTHPDEIAELAAQEMEQGDFAAAEELLRQGIELCPDHACCRAYLSVCVAALGRNHDAAADMAREVIADHPGDPAGWFALGQVHLLAGKRGAAFQHFAQAREVAGQDRRFQALLDRQDPRRRPVLGSLPRDHVFNLVLGRLRGIFRRR